MQLTYTTALARARNVALNAWIINTQADKHTLELRQNFASSLCSRNTYVSLAVRYTSMQWRISASADFTPPPPAYYLIDVEASTTLILKQNSLSIVTIVNNVANLNYPDYKDRFRYFANAPGRNFYLRLIFNLQ